MERWVVSKIISAPCIELYWAGLGVSETGTTVQERENNARIREQRQKWRHEQGWEHLDVEGAEGFKDDIRHLI